MEIYREIRSSTEDTAIALGCFDGIHRGHRQVLELALQKKQYRPAVFTFFGEDEARMKHTTILMSDQQKIDLLQKMGFRSLFSLHFDDIREMEPEQFVNDLLIDTFRAKFIACGFNFHFGKKGRGDAEYLKKLCAARGVECAVLPAVMESGEPISSTRIRRYLSDGEVVKASCLQGHPFAIEFEVVKGNRIGRTLGTPTINQPFPENFTLPKFGVYASVVTVDEKKYAGVTNVGRKPTVGSEIPLAETWIDGYSGDLYGQTPKVELLQFLRPERKFASLDELKMQIHADGEQARKITARWMDSDREETAIFCGKSLENEKNP